MKLGAIELGGTKMVCALGNEEGKIYDRYVIETKGADETLKSLFSYFKEKNIEALGIASFGPIDLNEESETYGFITTTPKPGWENVDVLSYFKGLNIPLGFDTDVNGACLGEVRFGAGKGLNNVIYGTVGTGIGFGVYLEGGLLHGLMHPETGHMLLKKHETDMGYRGPCPYHENCLESLASGPSIEKRWMKKARDLYDEEKVWDLEAYYLGQALCNCIMCYSPEKIILGGGVMHTPGLLEKVRKETIKALNGYIRKSEVFGEEYIVTPLTGDDAGILGALELGRRKLIDEQL